MQIPGVPSFGKLAGKNDDLFVYWAALASKDRGFDGSCKPVVEL